MKFVYLIRAGNEYKVGVANNLKKRISAIQTSNAKKIELVSARRAINATLLEKSLHTDLEKYGGNGGREWFMLTPKKALEVAIKLNRTPEVETADLVIEDLNLDLRKVIIGYWDNLDREMRKGGILAKPPVKVQPVTPKATPKKNDYPTLTVDPLWDDALAVVKTNMKASTSLLQRRLQIGYGRAARLIEEMERVGLIGPLNGSQPRELFLSAHST